MKNKRITKAKKIITRQMYYKNHILITVDFQKKELGNIYIFKKENGYEQTESIEAELNEDPLFFDEPIISNEQLYDDLDKDCA